MVSIKDKSYTMLFIMVMDEVTRRIITESLLELF